VSGHGTEQSHREAGNLQAFFSAMDKSDEAAVNKLLSDEISLKEIVEGFNNGQTALYKAAASGKADVVKKLVAAGAKVNVESRDQKTPLYIAAEKGHTDAAIALLEAPDIKVDLAHRKKTPLLVAAHGGHHKIVQALAQKNASLNTPATERDTSLQIEAGDTALHVAARLGHGKVVQILLQQARDPEIARSLIAVTNANKDTPLILAAEHCGPETVQIMLDSGADLTAQNENGDTALHRAARSGKDDVIVKLLEAAESSDLTTAVLDALNDLGNTPLLEAALQGSTRSIEVLVDAGADLGCTNHDQENALHLAAAEGHEQAIAVILDEAAKIAEEDPSAADLRDILIGSENDEECTPFDIAIKERRDGATMALVHAQGMSNIIMPRDKENLLYFIGIATERGGAPQAKALLKNVSEEGWNTLGIKGGQNLTVQEVFDHAVNGNEHGLIAALLPAIPEPHLHEIEQSKNLLDSSFGENALNPAQKRRLARTLGGLYIQECREKKTPLPSLQLTADGDNRRVFQRLAAIVFGSIDEHQVSIEEDESSEKGKRKYDVFAEGTKNDEKDQTLFATFEAVAGSAANADTTCKYIRALDGNRETDVYGQMIGDMRILPEKYRRRTDGTIEKIEIDPEALKKLLATPMTARLLSILNEKYRPVSKKARLDIASKRFKSESPPTMQ
jgi:ankyrin repeat protein